MDSVEEKEWEQFEAEQTSKPTEKDPMLDSADQFGAFGLTGQAGIADDIDEIMGW